MAGYQALFVRIRDAEGRYVGTTEKGLAFTDDVNRAIVFDSRRDRVQDHLARIQQKLGIALELETVDPREIHETCDRCGRLALSFQMFYDGERYLCQDCRKRAAANRPKP